MDKSGATKIADILPTVVNMMGLADRVEEVRLMKEWSKVVGHVVAERSRPGELRDGVLTVYVDSSVWMQELWFHRNEILSRIGELFPGVAVKSIRLEIEREKK